MRQRNATAERDRIIDRVRDEREAEKSKRPPRAASRRQISRNLTQPKCEEDAAKLRMGESGAVAVQEEGDMNPVGVAEEERRGSQQKHEELLDPELDIDVNAGNEFFLDSGSERSLSNCSPLQKELDQSDAPTPPMLQSGDFCPYCNRDFRKPRVLDCLHSMCEDCIIAQLDGRNEMKQTRRSSDEHPTPPGVIRCPVCSQDSHVGNDVRFVNDMLLDYIRLKNMPNGSSNAVAKCQSCKSGQQAISYCQDCRSYLCALCFNAHHDMLAFHTHSVIDLQDMGRMLPGFGFNFNMTICTLHRQSLEKYCVQCKLALCSMCLVDDVHKSHEVYVMDEKARTVLCNEIASVIQYIEERASFTAQARSKIPDRITAVNAQYERCCKKIADQFNFYAKVLEDTKVKCMEQLEQKRAEYANNYNRLYEKIDQKSARIHDAVSFAQRLVDKGSAVEIMASRKKVLTQLEQLDHGIPDANTTVEIDFDVHSPDAFRKQFESIAGSVKCMAGSIAPPRPVEDISVRASAPNLLIHETLDMAAWPPLHPMTAPQPQPPRAGGPGTIGMERKNRQLNGSVGIPRNEFHGDWPPSSVPPDVLPPSPRNDPLMGAMPPVGFASRSMSVGASMRPNIYSGGGSSWGNQSVTPVPTPLNSLPGFYPPSVQNYSPARPAYNQVTGVVRQQRGAVDNLSMQTAGLSLNGFDSISSSNTSVGVIGDRMGTRKSSILELRLKFVRGTSLGCSDSQFNAPQGFTIGPDDDIVIADTNNHRIVVISSENEFKGFFGNAGADDGYLYYPRKVIAVAQGMQCRYLIIDRGGNDKTGTRFQLFTDKGQYVSRFEHQTTMPMEQVDLACLNKDSGQLVLVDKTSTVFLCHFEGVKIIPVRHFSLTDYCSDPSDIVVNMNFIYVSDYKAHCVVMYSNEGSFLRKFGSASLTPFPVGLDISNLGDVIVADAHGNHFHVTVFTADGQPLQECDSNYKVSRCAAIRVMPNSGNLVTLSRHNNCVMVFEGHPR
ncbi:hypothetical protein QR680_004909 [Steinernema hermaphroditum]|uniref:B box-type domain-containing protein n=1 Tax=Steinernema hermaphroditum TaxID=289476 RepID=A0AA39HRA9_9BILA|nr:hypothetical protein QR680_004909 [Steinernema hermaphroditum]